MRKDTLRTKVLTAWLLFSLILIGQINALGNWGIEVKRADESDQVKLLADHLSINMAKHRIGLAIAAALKSEQIKQLVYPERRDLPNGELESGLSAVYNWWVDAVKKPSVAIATNPAATCAEATAVFADRLGIARQMQLMGMFSEAQDNEETSEFNDLYKKTSLRCHEEALDECVATGRFEQIFQYSQGEARQAQILGGMEVGDYGWEKRALDQCAIYTLHFVSTTSIDQQGMKFARVLDGRIKLTLEVYKDDAKLPPLIGQTEGGHNPFLVSINCVVPGGLQASCSPGATPTSPFKAIIRQLQMKHIEYYLDAEGIAKPRIMGDDKIMMELMGGTMMVDMVISAPGVPGIPLPFEIGGTPFYAAHYKDRMGQGMAVKFERTETRGVYPVLFEIKYADQNTQSNVPATDSTIFEIIHTPAKPEKVDPKQQPEKEPPMRKPLRKH